MKFLILHLSDSHFKDDKFIIKKRIDKIIDGLNIFNSIERVIIVFTGDVAQQGIRAEYQVARKFLAELISKIRNKFEIKEHLKVFLVPGNHDLDYTKNRRNGEFIQQCYADGSAENYALKEEPKLLEEFMKFSKERNCFIDSIFLDQKIVEIDKDFKLKINLVNSAVFSSLDNDKGNHYLPSEEIEKLYLRQDDIDNEISASITIMHHNYEWFHDNIYPNVMKAIYSGSSLLFLGHEHNPLNKKTVLDDKEGINLIAGGVLNKSGSEDSSFNAVSVDSSTGKVEIYKYVWSGISQFYEHKCIGNNELYKKKPCGNKLYPTEEFIKRLLEDEKHEISESFMEYFIFPRLERITSDKYAEQCEICSFEKTKKHLLDSKRIIIEGNENSGKTTLLKYIFLELAKEKTPLFFYVDDIKNKEFPTIVKNAFRQQYGEIESDYSKFQQLDKFCKIALIDDADNIKEKALEKLLKALKNEFDFIVITVKSQIKLDIVKMVKEHYKGESFEKFKLTNFFYDKRSELIKKVSGLLMKKENSNNDEIEDLVRNIDNFIKNQLHIFKIDPDFIIQYVKFFVENLNANSSYNVYNMVFESNLVNAVREYARESQISVDQTVLLMEEFAHFIHFHKKYPISADDCKNIVDRYNEEYGENIGVRYLLELGVKAKIIKPVGAGWEYKFCNSNYLAFFVARRLSRRYNEDSNMKDIVYILNNICFGINGNIVLFLSYTNQNIRILKSILNAAEKHMERWTEFSLTKGNIEFVSLIRSDIKIEPPTAIDRKERIESQTKIERDLKKDEVVETVDLYDYDENGVDQFEAQVITALKYTEIIAKALPNFSHLLKKGDKEAFIKGLYSYPNKIIFKLLKDFDQSIDTVVDEIILDFEKTDMQKKLAPTVVKEFFAKMSVIMILNVYNFIANISSNKRTIHLFNEYEYENELSYYIQNILIEENIGNVESFVQKANKLSENNKNHVIKYMLQQIVWKCLVCNENLERTKVQSLIAKYFPSQEKDLLLIKASRASRRRDN